MLRTKKAAPWWWTPRRRGAAPARRSRPCSGALATYDGADFVKVDVDDLDDVAEACAVQAMPTFQIFVNGAKKDAMTGASEAKLTAFVDTHCGKKTK